MDAADADVSDSQVVISPAPYADRGKLLITESILVEVDDMQILLPGLRLVLLGKWQILSTSRLRDVRFQDDVVVPRLRDLK